MRAERERAALPTVALATPTPASQRCSTLTGAEVKCAIAS
jgi:hypothetical protein